MTDELRDTQAFKASMNKLKTEMEELQNKMMNSVPFYSPDTRCHGIIIVIIIISNWQKFTTFVIIFIYMNGFQTVLAQNWTHVTYEPNNDSAQRFLFHLERFFIDYNNNNNNK